MPTLFSLTVDNVVWNWLELMAKEQLVAQEGLGLALGRCLVLLYANEGVVVSWDLEWIQGALNVLLSCSRYIHPISMHRHPTALYVSREE